MKRFITLVLFGLASIAAFAAENPAPVVTVTDDGNCYVDGVNAGQPQDVIANNRQIAPAVGAAYVAYHKAVQVQAQQLAAELAAVKAELATVKAERDALKAKYEPPAPTPPAGG